MTEALIVFYRDKNAKIIYNLDKAVLVEMVIENGPRGTFDVEDFGILPDEIPEDVGGLDLPLEMLKPKPEFLKTHAVKLHAKALKAFDESQPCDKDGK